MGETTDHQVHIIGGGLAGSEAAWQLAQAGVKVRLSEMRGGGDMTPAHQTDGLAELVCSNSFRSDDADKNAVGLLHQEMRRFMPFHAAGLRAGGRDHGAPGLRPHYGSNYYAAFILNPDGINVEAVCHAEVDLNAAENIS